MSKSLNSSLSMSDLLKTWVTNKALLVRPDGMVLFLRDSGKESGHEYTKDWWGIPGGRMDENETDFVLSMRREIVEELGCDIPEGSKPELIST